MCVRVCTNDSVLSLDIIDRLAWVCVFQAVCSACSATFALKFFEVRDYADRPRHCYTCRLKIMEICIAMLLNVIVIARQSWFFGYIRS